MKNELKAKIAQLEIDCTFENIRNFVFWIKEHKIDILKYIDESRAKDFTDAFNEYCNVKCPGMLSQMSCELERFIESTKELILKSKDQSVWENHTVKYLPGDIVETLYGEAVVIEFVTDLSGNHLYRIHHLPGCRFPSHDTNWWKEKDLEIIEFGYMHHKRTVDSIEKNTKKETYKFCVLNVMQKKQAIEEDEQPF